MIFCARATRVRRRPSPGLMARLGVPVGGRVRKSRAVEDQSAPIPKETTSELGGSIIEAWSLDARSECQAGDPHGGGGKKMSKEC